MAMFGMSDVGRRRASNQDRFDCVKLAASSSLIALFDGMGGAAGGSIASETARDTLRAKVSDEYSENMSDRQIKNLLLSSLDKANLTVFTKSVEDETLGGMGTTAVASIIKNDTAYIANIGDSRAYLIRDNELMQITTDHSIVQLLIENGQISADEAKIHPKRNIITRALGVSDSIKADFFQLRLNDKDKIMLCSDGLTNFVENEDILRCTAGDDLEKSVNELILCANFGGGGDNITVVLFEYNDVLSVKEDN